MQNLTAQYVGVLTVPMDSTQTRPASLVDWYTAPELVTVDQSAFLCGISPAQVREIMNAGGVDLVERDGDVLIDKASLREFWDLFWELRIDARDDD